MSFATRLRALREERGLSQTKLAEQLGVTRSLVTMYESGDRKPSFDTLCALGEILDVRINALVADDPPMVKITEEECELLELFRSSDPQFRGTVISLLKAHHGLR